MPQYIFTQSEISYMYETMRLYWADTWGVTALSYHIERMYAGLQKLDVKDFSTFQEFSDAFLDTVRRQLKATNLEQNTTYRLRVFFNVWDSSLTADVSENENKIEGAIQVGVYEGTRYIPEVKSKPAQVSIAAREHATTHDMYENLLVDTEGVLREGAWTNFYWLSSQGIWKTSAMSILPGVTRRLVLEVIPSVIQEDASLETVRKEGMSMVLSNAMISCVPVSCFEDKELQMNAAETFCDTFRSESIKYFEAIE